MPHSNSYTINGLTDWKALFFFIKWINLFVWWCFYNSLGDTSRSFISFHVSRLISFLHSIIRVDFDCWTTLFHTLNECIMIYFGPQFIDLIWDNQPERLFTLLKWMRHTENVCVCVVFFSTFSMGTCYYILMDSAMMQKSIENCVFNFNDLFVEHHYVGHVVCTTVWHCSLTRHRKQLIVKFYFW